MGLPGTVPLQTFALAMLLALLVGGVVGFNLGQDNVEAEQAGELRTELADVAEQGARTSTTNTAARAEGAKAQLQNEDRTHAAQTRARATYRDEPVGPDCREPAGVVRLGTAEVERANDRVRAAAGLAAPAVPDR